MKYKHYFFALLISAFSTSSHAVVGPNYVRGKITNLTSIPLGLLVRINADEKPENCASAQPAWMLVEQKNVAMNSVLLTAWTLGRRVDILTRPYSGAGYCIVTQVNPAES